MLKTVTELEKLTENYDIKTEELKIMRASYNESMEKMQAYETTQTVLMEENSSLKIINTDLEERMRQLDTKYQNFETINSNLEAKLKEMQGNTQKFKDADLDEKNSEIDRLKQTNSELLEKIKEAEKSNKTLTHKVADLQNSHLSLAKSHHEKSEEFHKKIVYLCEDNKKLKEEAKKSDFHAKSSKENQNKVESSAKSLEAQIKRVTKELDDYKARESQHLIEIESQKQEIFELSEKIKIKIKGYSILKSHFYEKYEELVKVLIQKDKELEQLQAKGGKENVRKGSRIYEFFKRRKGEGAETQLEMENDMNKDLMLLNEDKLSEKTVLECIDMNTTCNSIKNI